MVPGDVQGGAVARRIHMNRPQGEHSHGLFLRLHIEHLLCAGPRSMELPWEGQTVIRARGVWARGAEEELSQGSCLKEEHRFQES